MQTITQKQYEAVSNFAQGLKETFNPNRERVDSFTHSTYTHINNIIDVHLQLQELKIKEG